MATGIIAAIVAVLLIGWMVKEIVTAPDEYELWPEGAEDFEYEEQRHEFFPPLEEAI